MNITWNETTEERYDKMLGVVPPEYMTGYGFLVGEAFDHRECSVEHRIAPTFDAFVNIGEAFYEASEPLTVAEFIAAKLPQGFLTERMKRMAPGYYTERDGGRWYIVTPDHGDRVGEEFKDRDDARRFVCWLAGDPLPEGWTLRACGDGRIAYDLTIPGQYSPATVWARTCRNLFPARAAVIPQISKVEG